MPPTSDSQPDNNPAGTVLYLESDELDPTESFCTEVFDEADEGDYRVVQLTATQSFESLSDALNLQLEHIRDPSEAAVIITTPQADEESTTAEVGDGTLLHGFRVSPEDLTGISIAFSRLVENWESTEGTVKICLRDIESLLPYHDSDLLYRFLNTVLATLQGSGAEVHAHFSPETTDEQTLQLIQSLFDEVVEEDESSLEPSQEAVGESAADRSTAAPPAETEQEADSDAPDDVAATTMSDGEVDSFLQSEGYGILAFDGDSPYAIPMSYGYDPDERVLYVHMATYAGSEKQRRLEASDDVSLVVSQYDRPDQWRSVVVDGSLSRLSEDAVRERNVLDAFASSELASVDVFNRDLSEVDFEWYALEPSTMEGRQGAGAR